MGTVSALRQLMLGERLHERLEELIARYVARLRADSAIPNAKTLPRPLLEDHAMSFLGDLFQSIVVLERAKELQDFEEANLLKDGSQIQRLIAELHGRQRHRLGWTEAAVHRDYEILDEEIAALLKRQASTSEPADEQDWALDHLKHVLNRAHEASIAAFGSADRA